jgi:anaerobic nitric oxide reductase flavorubredoxin
MAEAIGQAEGIQYKLFHVGVSDRNDVVAGIFRAKAIVVGSPTFNQGVLPTMAPIFEDLRGLKFQNKIGAAFGSYGWSGEALAIIEDHLNRCKIPLVAEGVKARWQPREEDLSRCRDLGQKVAQALKADAG